MRGKRDPTFDSVIEFAEEWGFYSLLGIVQEWNCELVAQFFSTAWFEGHGEAQTIHFSLEGHHFSVSLARLVNILELPGDDLDRRQVFTEATISDNALAPLHLPGMGHNTRYVQGLRPVYKVLNGLFRVIHTQEGR